MNLRHHIHRHRATITIVSSLVVILATAWMVGSHFLLGSIAIGGALIGVIVFLYPETAFIASIGSIIIGQLIRIPVGSSEILPNDVIIPALIVVWTLRRLASQHWGLRKHSLTLPLVLMITIMGLSLVANIGRENASEWWSGSLYFVRWIEYLALFWIGQDYFRTHQRAHKYLSLLVWVGVVLAVLGFIQLKVFPDFSSMVPKGWDPHIGRLLSTWFDPNYLGGLFTVITAVALGVALSVPFRQARWWWVAVVALTLATVLTYSRSGYVGFVIAMGFVALFRSRTMLIIGLLAMMSVILFVPRVQERVIGIRTIDETAQLRLVSYQNAFTVIGDHPWLGIGYNLYKYVQVEYNFMTTTSEHSASGSDSSLLTVWVTTGTIGLAVYLWLFVAMLLELWKTWKDRALSAEWRGFGLGAFAGMLGLFAHSQFVNGLQYPHLMELMWLLVAMAIAVRQPSKT